MIKVLVVILMILTGVYCSRADDEVGDKIYSEQVPNGIDIKGEFIDGIQFSDKDGKHLIIISGNTNGTEYQDNWSSKLFAAKHTMLKDSILKKWEIKDFSTDNFSEVRYVKNSLTAFDVDNDGIKESRFMYQILHGGDPFDVKYMFHFKNVKYAIRGIVPIGFDDSTDCETRVDPVYNTLDLRLADYAKKDWEQLVTEEFSCFVVKK